MLTIAGVGKTLGASPKTLVPSAIEQLQDTSLTAHSATDSALEVVLDRLCLSLAVAKPVGLATWAEREGQRFGAAGAAALASAAAHSIATAAYPFDVDHGRLLATLEVLKGEIDRALMAQRPNGKNQTMSVDVTASLLTMLGERDHATCSHSRATAEWARRIAQAMNLSQETVSFVEMCAVLHDIGKISTPDRILFKPGALNADEWEIMREHSGAGARILEQIPGLAKCAPIVKAHHERYDGLGYPDGLAGIDIPFEARLVAVADAFHAMISDRPYRKATAPRQALEILAEGRGTQWDPDVVDAMLSLFKRPAVRQTQSEDDKKAVNA